MRVLMYACIYVCVYVRVCGNICVFVFAFVYKHNSILVYAYVCCDIWARLRTVTCLF